MAHWLHVPRDWRKPASDVGYDLYWSDASEFGQIHPRPTPAEVAGFYEVDYYTHGDAVGTLGMARPIGLADRVRRHLAWRVDRGAPLSDARVLALAAGSAAPAALDVGCGNGRLLAVLRAESWATAGVEPDPAACAVAAQKGLDVYPGVAEDLPPEVCGRRYDVIVMMHVLHQCLDPIRALREAGALLKPGGALVVEVPNNAALGLGQAGTAWPWLDVPRHLSFFTAKSLALACEAVGLVAGRPEYTGYTRQFSEGWRAIEEAMRAALGYAPIPASARGLRAWRLLLQTAFAAPARKYDSVRIIARPAARPPQDG
jgi:SAM-dependent methyltransferase